MWMKWMGCGLVTLSCGALGIWKAGQWKERRRTLEQLRKMILLLKGEILYAHTPLGEALEHVGSKSEGALGQLFLRVAKRIAAQEGQPFFKLWQEEIGGLPADFPMEEKERQDLTGLGEQLGYLDMDMQERTILLYLEQLEMSLGFYREHERERCRLCTSLGIMGGLFLSVMMY